MSSPPEKQVDALETWLDGFVTLEPSPPGASALSRKIDVLDRSLQLLRQRVQHLQNDIELERFLAGELVVGPGGLRYRATDGRRSLPRAISSLLYQPYLLVFLLLYHRRFKDVRVIIRELVRRLWNNLGPRDFDTTQKGAMRCVTNTHFAANALRRIGLLRFGDAEAYKTWVLSFPGFIAAARLCDRYKPWDIPANEDRNGGWGPVVHYAVFDALRGMDDFDGFCRWLEQAFDPIDSARYPILDRLIEQAHNRMSRHRALFESGALTRSERSRESAALVAELLGLPDAELFYQQLSDYMMESTTFRTVRQRWGADDDDDEQRSLFGQ